MRTQLWQRAAAFAARAHSGQVRRDGVTPYFSHAARVAMTVSHLFGCTDEVALAAAYLHDTIEDTTTDYEDLVGAFGKHVTDCVAALTKNMALPEDARERDYDSRLAAADWRSRLIKLADTYDNLLDTTTPAKRRTALIKCRRAIALAKSDTSKHPEVARALSVVEPVARAAARA